MNTEPKAAPRVRRREKPGTRRPRSTRALDTVHNGRMAFEMILGLLANNNRGSCSTSDCPEGWLRGSLLALQAFSFEHVSSCALRRRAQATYCVHQLIDMIIEATHVWKGVEERKQPGLIPFPFFFLFRLFFFYMFFLYA